MSRMQSRTFARVQKIIKRSRYGVTKLVNRYKDLVFDSFDFENVINGLRREFEDGVSVLDDFSIWLATSQNDLIRLLGGVLVEAYSTGLNRVFDQDGNKVSPSFEVGPSLIGDFIDRQGRFIRNISERETRRLRRDIALAREQGKGFDDVRDGLLRSLKSRTRSQCERIGRSEIIALQGRAQMDLMSRNGVGRYTWIAALDRRTCETCRNLHRTTHRVGRGPKPVEDTHPNCRCVTVVARGEN